jgi:hypothetical protein
MKRLLIAAALVASLALPAPAMAVNDPFVPAENCAPANAEAVGHPAITNEQSPGAGAPFSANNPGQSTGARGNNSAAAAHCPG